MRDWRREARCVYGGKTSESKWTLWRFVNEAVMSKSEIVRLKYVTIVCPVDFRHSSFLHSESMP